MAVRLWEQLTGSPTDEAALIAALGVPPVIARLLCLRGLADPDAAARFLRPSLDQLHDPFRLADMAPAVERLLAAIARGERIAIHGDYDVDGITATVIVRRALEGLGGDVIHFIPDRIQDGYGLQPPAIERLHAQGARVIVSVDCGIRGRTAADRARELGVDLIVTDHHEPDPELPPAVAVVNPRRSDCRYPDRDLAGVGVALKLVQALCARTGREGWLPAFVKIAAIGTVADVVPLVGENRIIAKVGLELLSRGPHKVGLRALLEVSGLAGRAIDSYQVAFILAPRVNAAGRMSTPELAARLLLATDESMAEEARQLAGRLDAENARRQREEQEILAQARRQIETDPDVGARSVLVVAGEGWHRGVVGIVASKLVDAFARPVIVLAIEDTVAHGSCRSIPAFDMLSALEKTSRLLLRYGGHRQAAGLTLEVSAIRAFRDAICQLGDATLTPDDLRPRLLIDASLDFPAVSGALVEHLLAMEPFGEGNPRPVFLARGVELADGPRRVKDRHLRMALRQRGRTFRAMAWRAADREQFFGEHRTGLDVAYSLVRNEYNGNTTFEVSLIDAQPTLRVADSP